MWLPFILGLLLLPACAQDQTDNNNVIDFADSVIIIRELLRSNSLAKILENPEPGQLDFLINNFSPAEIAFESEVLNCTDSVIVFCYQKLPDQNLIAGLQKKYPEQKIVLINGDQFPFLMYDLEVESYPTILMVKQREEIERFEEQRVIVDQK